MPLQLPTPGIDDDWDDDDNHHDQHRCQPHRIEQGQQPGKSGKGKLPEFPGTVTTVCVGKHPTDVAVIPGRNLAVVANSDSRSLSMVDIRTARVVNTVQLPARPTRVVVAGDLAAAVGPSSHGLFLINLASAGYPVTPVPMRHGSVDVALDATKQLAMVLDRHGQRVDVVSLRTSGYPIVGTLTLPHRASQLTYSEDLGFAFLGSSKERGLLFVVDVADNPSAPVLVRTIALSYAPGLGHHDAVNPQGIAYNSTTGDVVILDKDGTLLTYNAVGDLLGQAYTVAKEPLRDVAADPVRNMALVPGQNDDAYIVDLTAQASIYHVSVGRKPVAAAVNRDPTSASAGTAVVVNRNENSVSLFAMPDVPLRITALVPSGVPVGNPSFTLTIQGTGFSRSSVVRFGGTSITPTFVSSNQLTAEIPAALVANVGTVPVTVTNGKQTTLAAQFSVYPPQNPKPVILSLLPTGSIAGVAHPGGVLQLLIGGYGFIPASQVRFNGTLVTSSLTSGANNQILAVIPDSLLTNPGSVTVSVTNPTPGGGVATTTFGIVSGVNPANVTTTPIPVPEYLYSPTVGGASTYGAAVDPAVPVDTANNTTAMAVVALYGNSDSSALDNRVFLLSNVSQTPPTFPTGAVTLGQNPQVRNVYAPNFTAVNPNTHVALINSFSDGISPGAVSLVNLMTGAWIADVQMGSGPFGVAVDPNPPASASTGRTFPKGIGLVANVGSGAVTILDLDTTQGPPQVIAQVSAPALSDGRFTPYGVATYINPQTQKHMAVVVDGSTSPGRLVLVELSDPASPSIATNTGGQILIPVGTAPNLVAVDSNRSLAVVSNQFDDRTNNDNGSVSVVDLSSMTEKTWIELGQQPYGVAIDTVHGIAGIVNLQSFSITLINYANPTPSVMFTVYLNLTAPQTAAVLPGVSGTLRLLITDLGSSNMEIVEVSGL